MDRTLGERIDDFLDPLFPSVAAKRRVSRMAGALAVRQYEAAGRDQRSRGWLRPSTSADAEVGPALAKLRDSARDLCRNNKYAAAAKAHMTAQIIGDGIAARAVHPDKPVAEAAQAEWDRWSCSKVHEGRNDHYYVQKLIAGGMVESGEMLVYWQPRNGMPDSAVVVLEGDYLDSTKTKKIDGGRIVQGVQFNNDGERAGYWLFDDHPGDTLISGYRASRLHDARDIDHVFEQQRAGQTRGVSWFAPVALDLRDIADIEAAMALKKKMETYIGLVLTPDSDAYAASPLSPVDPKHPHNVMRGQKAPEEKMSPGFVFRTKPGEQALFVNPTTTSDTVGYIRQQLAAISAVLAPYHLMTGDVTNANYTSLRAALLGFGSRLDDVQQQVIIPYVCQSAFDRRMRVLAARSGDRRFLSVAPQWAVPSRALLDPVKDLMGEILGIRAGLQSITHSLGKRGIDVDKHFAELARINALIDQLGLALDSDPRRLTGAGILQTAAGYLIPKGDNTNA